MNLGLSPPFCIEEELYCGISTYFGYLELQVQYPTLQQKYYVILDKLFNFYVPRFPSSQGESLYFYSLMVYLSSLIFEL